MQPPPKPAYRIVERDGKLVVEPGQSADSGTKPNRRFSLPSLDFTQRGLDLFRQRHDYEATPEGDAIISAAQLSGYEQLVKLDARSDDLYYVTPAQQALLGWFGLATQVLFGGVVVLILIATTFDLPAFLVFVIGGGCYYAAAHHLKLRLGAIASQQYLPADSPSEPAPC